MCRGHAMRNWSVLALPCKKPPKFPGHPLSNAAVGCSPARALGPCSLSNSPPTNTPETVTSQYGMQAVQPPMLACQGASMRLMASMLSEYTVAVMAQPRNQMVLKRERRMDRMAGAHCTWRQAWEGGGRAGRGCVDWPKARQHRAPARCSMHLLAPPQQDPPWRSTAQRCSARRWRPRNTCACGEAHQGLPWYVNFGRRGAHAGQAHTCRQRGPAGSPPGLPLLPVHPHSACP